MNNLGIYHTLLTNSIVSFKSDPRSCHGECFRVLFMLSFGDLKQAEVGNPLIHHIVVFQHMVQIAREEDIDMLQAGAIALLHDIAPIKKIRVRDVDLEPDENKRQLLKQQRWQHRTLHMREGSAIAQKKLLLLNEYIGKPIYSDEDIDIVCEVIRIHDNPSIFIPIPKENRLAVAFREADRLWMLSDEGFKCDLRRDLERLNDQSAKNNLARKRLDHIITRFQKERQLYFEEDGPFLDSMVFFRTKAGYTIYQQYLHQRENQYKLE